MFLLPVLDGVLIPFQGASFWFLRAPVQTVHQTSDVIAVILDSELGFGSIPQSGRWSRDWYDSRASSALGLPSGLLIEDVSDQIWLLRCYDFCPQTSPLSLATIRKLSLG